MTGANRFRRDWTRRAALAVVLLGPWVALQIVFRDRLVYHDSWRHGFPIFYAVAKETTCRGLPRWLGVVDSGSPLIIYVMSFSLLQIVRLPALLLTGCLRLDVVPAMYVYQAQFLASYLALAGGMFVLGRLLFSRRLSQPSFFSSESCMRASPWTRATPARSSPSSSGCRGSSWRRSSFIAMAGGRAELGS